MNMTVSSVKYTEKIGSAELFSEIDPLATCLLIQRLRARDTSA